LAYNLKISEMKDICLGYSRLFCTPILTVENVKNCTI
jgi:hypothetical protein